MKEEEEETARCARSAFICRRNAAGVHVSQFWIYVFRSSIGTISSIILCSSGEKSSRCC